MSCLPCDDDLVTGACDVLGTERLRYFTGRHMTARDFTDEQAYHRTHRLLHNRMLHGWGIVCGLQVRPHRTPDCRRDYVVVDCGMAVDCCGRELVMRQPSTEKIPWDTQPMVEGTKEPDPDTVLLLCIEYCESPSEKVPVLYSESACATPSMEHGRVREGVRLDWHWVRRDELPSYGWRTDEGHRPGAEGKVPADDCDDGGGDRRCCVDADCPEHDCVPLAVLTRHPRDAKADPKDMTGEPTIHATGRRPLGERRAQLTHISWINWPHGGVVSPGWLAAAGRLEARFDRRLEAAVQPADHCGPRGINACTFMADYGDNYEDVDPVTYAREHPPYLAPDRRTAVFELDDPRPGDPYQYLVGHIVYITIKCDFLLDCHGQPVDGNHLGGRLPTGNGTPGGTFHSWFTVLSDQDYAQHPQGGAAQPGAGNGKEG